MPRPSTRNRVAVRIATIEATRATAVSSAIRAFGERVAVEAARDGEQHRPEREHADEQQLADQPRRYLSEGRVCTSP